MPKNNRKAVKTSTFRLNMNQQELDIFQYAMAKLDVSRTVLITYAIKRVIEKNKDILSCHGN
jgi:hypothetical protein